MQGQVRIHSYTDKEPFFFPDTSLFWLLSLKEWEPVLLQEQNSNRVYSIPEPQH